MGNDEDYLIGTSIWNTQHNLKVLCLKLLRATAAGK